MLRIAIFILIVIINLIFQVSFSDNIEILNTIPNTSLILVISYAYLRDDVEGGLFGFTLGLIQDIFFGSYLGLHALLYVIVGYIFGKPFKNMYPVYVLPVLLLIFTSTFMYEFGVYITSFLFRGRMDLQYYILNLILPEAIYNTLIGVPIYYFMYFINKIIEKKEKPYRKIFEKDNINDN